MKNRVSRVFLNLVFWSCLLLPASLYHPVEAGAAETIVKIHLFWTQGCPHCLLEKKFLAKLEAKYPQVRLHAYEISSSPENQELLQKVADQLKVTVSGVPFTVIGDQSFIWLAG